MNTGLEPGSTSYLFFTLVTLLSMGSLSGGIHNPAINLKADTAGVGRKYDSDYDPMMLTRFRLSVKLPDRLIAFGSSKLAAILGIRACHPVGFQMV